MICAFFLFAVMWISSCGEGATLVGPPLHEPVAGQADIAIVSRGIVEALDIVPGITSSPTQAARLEVGSGRIESVYAWPGDSVVEGQLLARLDSSHLDVMIEGMEESLARSQRLHHLQTEEMSLEIRLLEFAYSDAREQAQSAQGTPLYEAAIDNATRIRQRKELVGLELNHRRRRHNIDVEDMEIALSSLRRDVGETEVRSPIDGEVVYTVFPGAWVTASDPVMYIAETEGVIVEYIGMTIFASRFRDAVKLQGIINGRVYDLEAITPSREEQVYYRSRNLELPIRFEIRSELYDAPPVGEKVFIHLYSAWAEDVLRIPSNALFRSGQDVSFVYRREGDTQELVYVATGMTTGFYIEIVEGLNEGDEIFVRP